MSGLYLYNTYGCAKLETSASVKVMTIVAFVKSAGAMSLNVIAKKWVRPTLLGFDASGFGFPV